MSHESVACLCPTLPSHMTESPQQRSRIMRAVKGFDTAPEMTVRRLLHGMGYRYRLHRKDLPGSPDLVFPGVRKVVFVHGCYWHGHDCRRGARVPVHNREYWIRKIARNKDRDRNASRLLKALGWRSFVVWECQMRDAASLKRRLVRFLDAR
jgi:DNA mismatch endonuclease (patch repair protein)